MSFRDHPLVGREALRYVERQFREHGSTMYFLSFVNRIPRAKVMPPQLTTQSIALRKHLLPTLSSSIIQKEDSKNSLTTPAIFTQLLN